jgi:hypothetical protein
MIALLLIILCLVTSCLKTEVIGYEPEQAVDTVFKEERPMPPRPPKDTTDQDGRVPITFNPSVEDWEEIEENL